MVKIKEKRVIDDDELLCLLAKKNWYTKADEKDYDAIIDYVHAHSEITMDDIYKLAVDIIEHSEMESLANWWGISIDDPNFICIIMTDIASISWTLFELEEEPAPRPDKTLYQEDKPRKQANKKDMDGLDPMDMCLAIALLDTILSVPGRR